MSRKFLNDSYEEASSIFALNDGLLESIQKALKPLGWTLNITYDDVTYYNLHRELPDGDWETYIWEAEVDRASIHKMLPEWISRAIQMHSDNYRDFYASANASF